MTILKHHLRSVALCAASLMAVIVLGAGTVETSPQASGGDAPPPPQAAGGRGRGPAPVDTLGAGPWDLAAGRGVRIHVTAVKGLDHPWGIAFLPDEGLLVTERPGRLRAIRHGVLDPTPIGPMPQMLA